MDQLGNNPPKRCRPRHPPLPPLCRLPEGPFCHQPAAGQLNTVLFVRLRNSSGHQRGIQVYTGADQPTDDLAPADQIPRVAVKPDHDIGLQFLAQFLLQDLRQWQANVHMPSAEGFPLAGSGPIRKH